MLSHLRSSGKRSFPKTELIFINSLVGMSLSCGIGKDYAKTRTSNYKCVNKPGAFISFVTRREERRRIDGFDVVVHFFTQDNRCWLGAFSLYICNRIKPYVHADEWICCYLYMDKTNNINPKRRDMEEANIIYDPCTHLLLVRVWICPLCSGSLLVLLLLLVRGMDGRQHMNSNNRPMMGIISNTHPDIILILSSNTQHEDPRWVGGGGVERTAAASESFLMS